MRRSILNVLAALCLLLFCVLIAIRIRSIYVEDHFSFVHGTEFWRISSQRAYLIIDHGAKKFPFAEQDHDWWWMVEPRNKLVEFDPIPLTNNYRKLFGYGEKTGTTYFASPGGSQFLPVAFYRWGLADSTLAIVVGFFPLVRLSNTFRSWHVSRSRLGKGLCPTCGYDLRATPDRCPECGGVPTNLPADRLRTSKKTELRHAGDAECAGVANRSGAQADR